MIIIMKTQIQMFYEESRKIADANTLFMEFVKEGLTKKQLQKLIDHRPGLWKKYSHWLEKLP